MYTKDELIDNIKEMGLSGEETIMIHSSMKSVGEVEGGADTVVLALMEYFKEGLLLMPTHTWNQMSKEYNVFDKNSEKACVGIIPNIFMKKENVLRSYHLTHSVAAYGKKAEEYIEDDIKATTPCPTFGSFGKLRFENSKILLIGVTHIRNTFIHSIEEFMDIDDRFTKEQTKFYVVLEDGTKKEVEMYRHYNEEAEKKNEVISDSFDKMKEKYFETGAAKQVKFGDAECILCDGKKLFEVTVKELEKNKKLFI